EGRRRSTSSGSSRKTAAAWSTRSARPSSAWGAACSTTAGRHRHRAFSARAGRKKICRSEAGIHFSTAQLTTHALDFAQQVGQVLFQLGQATIQVGPHFRLLSQDDLERSFIVGQRLVGVFLLGGSFVFLWFCLAHFPNDIRILYLGPEGFRQL